jgi:(E)-4-hydroxy-3-methylbut-2-enyl-diphosphate synthase
MKDTPIEGLVVPIGSADELEALKGAALVQALLILEVASGVTLDSLKPFLASAKGKIGVLKAFSDASTLALWAKALRGAGHTLFVEASPEKIDSLGLTALGDEGLVVTCAPSSAWANSSGHALGSYRRLADQLKKAQSKAPLWIRNTAGTAVRGDNSFLSKLIEASILTGGLLCDGLGDFVSVETEADPERSAKLSYNLLQGAGARISKTEFVACPSCGRTLFDLQTTTQRIRAQTGHLKGVKLAIMGCIVNGPGEMADADFGYVGGAPGKINLYVGKQCVQYNIPQVEADARLIALIKEHGKWLDPEPAIA